MVRVVVGHAIRPRAVGQLGFDPFEQRHLDEIRFKDEVGITPRSPGDVAPCMPLDEEISVVLVVEAIGHRVAAERRELDRHDAAA